MNASSTPVVTIMAGGTGGHIFPGLAVAAALQELGAQVTWLGGRRGLEGELVPKAAIELDQIDVAGLRGKGATGWIGAPFVIFRAMMAARRALRQRGTDCVISMGGYAAGPGGLAARLCGIPLVVHEQNRIAGMTNRVLSKLAALVFEGFPGTFKPGPQVRPAGNPVRQSILALPLATEAVSGRPFRLLVMGGSQGAVAINRQLPASLVRLRREHHIQVRHQAGRGRSGATRVAYEEAAESPLDWLEVSEFIDEMAAAYAWADLVVCRAGALTVAEVAAAGLPAVFIPFPFAVDDHQTLNAAWLAEQQAAAVVAELALEGDTIMRLLDGWLRQPAELLAMGQRARERAFPEAAQTVARGCLEVIAR